MRKRYRVGYGRPPRESQFKPGQSGNPNGRPKGTGSLKSHLQSELSHLMVVHEGDRAYKVSKLRAAVKLLTSRGLQGSFKDLAKLVELYARHLGDQPEAADTTPTDEHDRKVLERALRQRQNSPAHR